MYSISGPQKSIVTRIYRHEDFRLNGEGDYVEAAMTITPVMKSGIHTISIKAVQICTSTYFSLFCDENKKGDDGKEKEPLECWEINISHDGLECTPRKGRCCFEPQEEQLNPGGFAYASVIITCQVDFHKGTLKVWEDGKPFAISSGFIVTSGEAVAGRTFFWGFLGGFEDNALQIVPTPELAVWPQ